MNCSEKPAPMVPDVNSENSKNSNIISKKPDVKPSGKNTMKNLAILFETLLMGIHNRLDTTDSDKLWKNEFDDAEVIEDLAEAVNNYYHKYKSSLTKKNRIALVASFKEAFVLFVSKNEVADQIELEYYIDFLNEEIN
jgi:hypothetical protein